MLCKKLVIINIKRYLSIRDFTRPYYDIYTFIYLSLIKES